MEKNIRVVFRIRNDQSEAPKSSPIYMKVTIDGSRLEWSTQRQVEKIKWSSRFRRVKGTNEDARTINAYLDLLEHMVSFIKRSLFLRKKS